jgi:hypothetical protein
MTPDRLAEGSRGVHGVGSRLEPFALHRVAVAAASSHVGPFIHVIADLAHELGAAHAVAGWVRS